GFELSSHARSSRGVLLSRRYSLPIYRVAVLCRRFAARLHAVRVPDDPDPVRHHCRCRHAVGEEGFLAELRQRRAGTGNDAGQDRSEEHTLNSSHVKLSYAVFFLKKKT